MELFLSPSTGEAVRKFNGGRPRPLSLPGPSNFPPPDFFNSCGEGRRGCSPIPRPFIPSHGREIFRGDIGPRLDRYLENIPVRERKILESLSSPKTLDELASLSLISGFRLSRVQVWFFFERNMIEKHLARLLAQEIIPKTGDRFQRETH